MRDSLLNALSLRFRSGGDSLRFYGFVVSTTKDAPVVIDPHPDCRGQVHALVDQLRGIEAEVAQQPTTLEQSIEKVRSGSVGAL